MSYLECNPNHCPSVIEMGKSLVVQELKINRLEQQKTELIEFIQDLSEKVYEAEQIRKSDFNSMKKYFVK